MPNIKYLKGNVSLLSVGLRIKILLKHNLILYLCYVSKNDMCVLNIFFWDFPCYQMLLSTLANVYKLFIFTENIWYRIVYFGYQ